MVVVVERGISTEALEVSKDGRIDHELIGFGVEELQQLDLAGLLQGGVCQCGVATGALTTDHDLLPTDPIRVAFRDALAHETHSRLRVLHRTVHRLDDGLLAGLL